MGIKTTITCDKCEKRQETYEGPYHVIKEQMREDGFRNQKIDDQWTILCADCRRGEGE